MIDWKEFEFSSNGFDHFDGHVGNCRHFDNGACNCDPKLLIVELQKLRDEAVQNEETISNTNPISILQARIEIARLRSTTKWQRIRIEALVIKPVLED